MKTQDNLSVIIFSKNRTMQLCALIESIKKYTNIDPKNIDILCKYDNKYCDSLYDLMGQHTDVSFNFEYNFNEQVIELLEKSKEYVVFFTDDDIIKNNIDVSEALILLENNPKSLTFSLRLGDHLNYCYPVKREQRVPSFNVENSNVVSYDFRYSEWDFNYPLSVNGHIFKKEHILYFSKNVPHWNSPNSYEGNLQAIVRNISDTYNIVYCHRLSSVINIPINKVQNEVDNAAGNVDVDYLHDLWEQNKKINFEKLFKIKNISAHQEIQLEFIDR